MTWRAGSSVIYPPRATPSRIHRPISPPHEKARNPARQSWFAGFTIRRQCPTLFARVSDGRPGDGRAVSNPLRRGAWVHPAIPSARVGPRLSRRVDPGGFAAGCHEPPCAGETAGTRVRAGGTGDALSESLNRERREPPGGAVRGRTAVDSAVPALRNVQLRNRGGAGKDGGRQTRASHDAEDRAAVFRGAGLHRSPGGHCRAPSLG